VLMKEEVHAFNQPMDLTGPNSELGGYTGGSCQRTNLLPVTCGNVS